MSVSFSRLHAGGIRSVVCELARIAAAEVALGHGAMRHAVFTRGESSWRVPG